MEDQLQATSSAGEIVDPRQIIHLFILEDGRCASGLTRLGKPAASQSQPGNAPLEPFKLAATWTKPVLSLLKQQPEEKDCKAASDRESERLRLRLQLELELGLGHSLERERIPKLSVLRSLARSRRREQLLFQSVD